MKRKVDILSLVMVVILICDSVDAGIKSDWLGFAAFMVLAMIVSIKALGMIDYSSASESTEEE